MFDPIAKLAQSPTNQPAATIGVSTTQTPSQKEIDKLTFQNTSFQCKLEIGSPDDPLEQEADAMADTIMRMPEQNFIQRKCSDCKEEDDRKINRKPLASFIQRKESGSPTEAPDSITNQINANKGKGSGMDDHTHSFMQKRFETDFSDVKIHTENESVQMNRELNAKAFTVGNDIYFNEGQYNPDSSEGKHLLAHELTHVVQQTGFLQTNLIQRRGGQPCTVMHPELCATYEEWMALFHTLPSFDPGDTSKTSGTRFVVPNFNVIGERGADRDLPAADPNAAVTPRSPRAADYFIDHPTQQWVSNNLPAELQSVAYRLPADCADIAVVLRHVWLFYHNRTESYRVGSLNWVIGFVPGETDSQRETRISNLITDQVYSGSVSEIVNPYSDLSGKQIRSFAGLSGILHPGDVMVWEHHANGLNRARTGGHTQTITHIIRDENTGAITSIDTVQGNQPINQPMVPAIQEFQRDHRQRVTSETTLRAAAGRRIEVSSLGPGRFNDITIGTGRNATQVWTWGDTDNTILLVAGPPAAASRFTSGRRVRNLGLLSNWIPQFGSASLTSISGILDSSMQAARAEIEGVPAGAYQSLSNTEAILLGQAVANQLASFTRYSTFDNGNYFNLILSLLRSITSFRESGTPAHTQHVHDFFASVSEGFIPICATILNSSFETKLQSVRSLISKRGSSAFSDANANGLGELAGTRIWAFAQAADDFARISHFDILVQQRASIQSVKGSGDTNQAEIDRIFDIIDGSLHLSSRGAGTGGISFSRSRVNPSGTTVIKTLLTGFDAFNLTNSSAAPRPREWNPSGAAVLALDGTTVEAAPDLVVNIEGIVFPVSFSDFRVGMVESVVVPFIRNNTVDSVITVSEDPSINATDAVRLEQYAVGVHSDAGNEAIPAVGTSNRGNMILEPIAPLSLIGSETAVPTQSIPRPRIGRDITFDFHTAENAGNALFALGLKADNKPAVSRIKKIDTINAIHIITSSMRTLANGIDISFQAGGNTFVAAVLSGPGGNFLSNEISFRILRLIEAQDSTNPSTAVSFHTHTQGGGLIVPEGTFPNTDADEHEQSRSDATGIRNRLIQTLQRIVASTARFIKRRRNP